MALYSFNRKIAKRTGRDGKVLNAVFAAAYYRAEKRTCHTIEETKDFSRKQSEVIYKDCLLPEDAPDWATRLRHSQIKGEEGRYQYDETGQTFSEYAWNLIEQMERRYDSQLYIRDIMALPIELNQTQAIALAKSYAQEVLAVDGVFCEVAVHWDLVNPHVHYMRSAFRTLTEEGFSKKVRLTQAQLKATLLKDRELWAGYANEHLALAGHEVRIDHRSYKDRGIDLTPTIKVGKATHMHGSEHQDIRIAENQRIRAENFQKIQANPGILATKLGQECGAFTQEQIGHELARHVVNDKVLAQLTAEEDASHERVRSLIMETLKREQTVFNERTLKAEVLQHVDENSDFQAIINAILASKEVYAIGLGEDGREYFVTREAFQLELQLITAAEHLNKRSRFLVSNTAVSTASEQYRLNEGQRRALRHMTQGSDIALVRGMAGTGKTYLLKPAREIWEQAGYRVHGVAFLGRAAAGLEQDAGINAKTIDRFLWAVQHGQLKLGARDIIVMDEKGMTSLDHMHALLRMAQVSGAKFVAVGDNEQTQSTRRGAPARALTETVGCAVLDEIIRQKVSWQKEATLHLETQQSAAGLRAYHEQGCLHFTETTSEAVQDTVTRWFHQFSETDDALKEHLMAAYTNNTVAHLNREARLRLIAAGKLTQGDVFQLATGEHHLSVGDRIVLGKNDNRLGVKNGHFAMIEAIEDQTLTIRLDSDEIKHIPLQSYNALTYGYAATIHKLQGYTGNHTHLYVDSLGFDRHLFLVGATRHRHSLSITVDHEHFQDYDALCEVISRDGLKDHVFDFPAAYSIRRGFDAGRITTRATTVLKKLTKKPHDAFLWLKNYQSAYETSSQKSILLGIKARRQQARIVADFCDQRVEVAVLVNKTHELPGQSLSLSYQHLPETEALDTKTAALYLDQGKLTLATQNLAGNIHSVVLSEASFSEAKHYRGIVEVLSDPFECQVLNNEEKKALFSAAASQGFEPIDADQKIAYQRMIYSLQLDNSQTARSIQDNYATLKIAMDRNRITRQIIEKSVEFGDRHEEMKSLTKGYQPGQFINATQAHNIMESFQGYYGHMIAALGKTTDLEHFINDVNYQAYQYHYEHCHNVIETLDQSRLDTLKHYLDRDYAFTHIHIDRMKATPERLVQRDRLALERNQLAHHIMQEKAAFEPMLEYFAIQEKRLRSHHAQHIAKERVEQFEQAQLKGEKSLHIDLLAHRIQQEARRHSPYVKELITGGWKTVNRVHRAFIQHRNVLDKSPGFKSAYRAVQRYREARQLARDAWEAAHKRLRAGSPNRELFLQRTYGHAYFRDQLASRLTQDLEQHAGALAFSHVSLATLMYRAKRFNLVQRYLRETHEARQLLFAHHIVTHLKAYKHLLATNGIETRVREQSAHYRYLKATQTAPSHEIKSFITSLEHYRGRNHNASEAWHRYKLLEKQGVATHGGYESAKHALYQRNHAAFKLNAFIEEHPLTTVENSYYPVDLTKITKQAKQHIAYQRVLTYLNASSEERPTLAVALLADRAGYHSLYDNGINFKTLRQEARAATCHTLSQAKSESHQRHWDIERIAANLMAQPETTYRALLGEPKKVSSREWRYENGLIVTIKGAHAGQWYSFTESTGGGPIQAIQKHLNLPFKEALEYGARLAGLSEAQALTRGTLRSSKDTVKHSHTTDHTVDDATSRRIQSAKSIWEGTQPLSGTLAEQYLNTHRKISKTDRLEIRFWPEGTPWFNEKTGKLVSQINRTPAGVIAIRNAKRELTGVQRIYLDRHTGAKNTQMGNAKLSKGIVKGAAGIIQIGKPGGTLYIAEGPETCASIACVNPEATVLASMGIHNLGKLAEVIQSFSPGEVIMAADNDGVNSKTLQTTQSAHETLTSALQQSNIPCHLVMPEPIEGLKKVDWNDVLVHQGEAALQKALQSHHNTSPLYYPHAQPIAYTPAEHYLREVRGLISASLSEARYHPSIPHEKLGKTPAIVIPAVNQVGVQKAELILHIDQRGEQLLDTCMHGNAKGAAVIIQETNAPGSLYFCDNYIDAQSITVGNQKANIYLSLDHYHDLDDLGWILDRQSSIPSQVSLVANTFTQVNEKALFEVSAPLRQRGIEPLMAKGRLRGDYTHTSINEALVRQKAIRGENYVQHLGIKAPVVIKTSLKERFKQRLSKTTITKEIPEAIKRPENTISSAYYVHFNESESRALQDYFNASERLTDLDTSKAALNLANSAGAVYDTLESKMIEVRQQPQRIKIPSTTTDTPITNLEDRILKNQPIGLHDFEKLMRSVATPRFDTKTQQQIHALHEYIAKGDYGKEYEKLASEFLKSNSKLIDAWQHKLMPNQSQPLLSTGSEIPIRALSREAALGVFECVEQDQANKLSSRTHKHGRANSDDDTGRGRSL